MTSKTNGNHKPTILNLPENPIRNLTVQEMYDKEKYDLSTMDENDVFKMLELVIVVVSFHRFF